MQGAKRQTALSCSICMQGMQFVKLNGSAILASARCQAEEAGTRTAFLSHDNQYCAVMQASKTKAPASGTPDDSPVRKVPRVSSAKGRGSRLSRTASAAAEETAAAAAAEAGDQPAGAGEAALGQATAAAHEAAAGLDAAAPAEAPAAGDREHRQRKENRQESRACLYC